MDRRSTHLLAALVLLAVALTVQALIVEDHGSRGLYVPVRAKRTTDKQFACVLPMNKTANEPYIKCGIINETQSEYPILVDLSDQYRPRFEYALFCPNFTVVEDEEEVDDADNRSDSSDDSDEDDSEEEEDLCLRAPYTDCSLQCVYKDIKLLNEEGLPEPDRLYTHVMEVLDSDVDFKTPVKNAVRICQKQLMDTVHKYGLDRLNMCLLLEIVDECLEFEIGIRCPKHNRFPYKKS